MAPLAIHPEATRASNGSPALRCRPEARRVAAFRCQRVVYASGERKSTHVLARWGRGETLHLLRGRLDQLRRKWRNPENITEAELKERTLTNLYNQRPTWLASAHAARERAVFAAHGWLEEIGDEEILKSGRGLSPRIGPPGSRHAAQRARGAVYALPYGLVEVVE